MLFFLIQWVIDGLAVMVILLDKSDILQVIIAKIFGNMEYVFLNLRKYIFINIKYVFVY